MIKRFLLLIMACIFTSSLLIGKGNIVKLEAQLPGLEGKERVVVLNELAIANRTQSLKDALNYAEKALSLSLTIGEDKSITTSKYTLGKVYKAMSDYSQALAYLSEALTEAQHLKDELLKGNILNTIGLTYKHLGNHKDALNYIMQSLDIYKQIADEKGIAKAYNNLATIYVRLEDYQTALKYHLNALKIKEKLSPPNHNSIASSYNNLGVVYRELGDLPQALIYYERALNLKKEQEDKDGEASALNNLGGIYNLQEQYTKALPYFIKCLNIREEINIENEKLILVLNNLADIYLKMGRFELATKYQERALSIASNIGTKERELQGHSTMSKIKAAVNNFEEAYIHQTAHAAIKDSLFNYEKLQEIANLNTRYEVQNKQKEIEDLQKLNEVQKSKNQLWQAGFVLFVLMSLGIAFLLYKWIKYRRVSNRLLEEKNEAIENQNQQLKRSNVDLEQFAYVASHDLKEPLRMIGSFTQLLGREQGEKLTENSREYMSYIVNGVRRMEILLEDLLRYSRVGKAERTFKKINMNDIKVEVLSNIQHQIADNNAQVIWEKELPIVEHNRTEMVQLLQNLISNAIKFKNGKDPIVQVNYELEEKNHTFSIKDNGIGIDKQYADKVFTIFQRLHSHTEYEGTGIGLAVCKKIVERCGGDIWFESELEQGTTFYFTIPEAGLSGG